MIDMGHTFGAMPRDREKKIKENLIKAKKKKEKENAEFDGKIKNEAFAINYELSRIESKIAACKWDIDHGFTTKQAEYNALIDRQKQLTEQQAKLTEQK